MIKNLLPFQVEGVEFLISRWHALLGDDMGLGKTFQTITAIGRVRPNRVLIICPAGMRTTWYRELINDLNWVLMPRILLQPRDVENIGERPFLWVCSYNFAVRHTWAFQDKDIDILICDESHYLRKLESQRTKAILGNFGIAQRAKYKWMLTGTAIHNRPRDLYPVLSVLASKKLGAYVNEYSFLNKFCGGPLGLGASCHKELKNRLEGFMLRRTKQEVLKELPPVTQEIIWLEQTPTLKALVAEGEEIWESVKAQAAACAGAAHGQLAKHRQQLALAKLPGVTDHIMSILEHEKKVVLFAYHISVIEALCKALEGTIGYTTYYGALTPKERDKRFKHFIERKECEVFIGQIIAAGTGLDGLQKVCSTAIFVEWDWTPGGNSQAMDRLNRMGQTNPVLVQFMAVRGSLEDRMLTSADRKLTDLKTILN